jgi:hypothetical protein
MRKEKHYDQDYCIRLIQSALLPRGKNPEINTCSIKLLILAKIEYLQKQYGLDTEDLFSEISRHFLEKKVIHKINPKKAGPTTFILHYVFNQLRNIERSCSHGNFENHRNTRDAMSNVTCDLEVLEDKICPGIWADPVDPESILLLKELVDQLLSELGAQDLSLLTGQISVEDYCQSTGSTRRSAFRRLASMRLRARDLLVADSY